MREKFQGSEYTAYGNNDCDIPYILLRTQTAHQTTHQTTMQSYHNHTTNQTTNQTTPSMVIPYTMRNVHDAIVCSEHWT